MLYWTMPKRRRAAVWILIGILIVFAVVLVWTKPRQRDSQPVYKGLTLAQWLDVVARGRINGYFPIFQKGRLHSKDATLEQIKEAEEAVRAIGTNALPSLLAWISYEPSHAKRLYRGILDLPPLPDHTRGFLWGLPGTKHEQLAEFAIQGFRLLNTNALPALADLSRLANDTKHPMTQILATKALLTVTNTPSP
jgi:hypothetical protein